MSKLVSCWKPLPGIRAKEDPAGKLAYETEKTIENFIAQNVNASLLAELRRNHDCKIQYSYGLSKTAVRRTVTATWETQVLIMNFADFKRQVAVISKERCDSMETNPLQYGIERASFEEQKLKQLIALADKAGCITAQRRKEAWLRQIDRVRASRIRLEKMQEDIASVRSKIEIALPVVKAQTFSNPRKMPARQVVLR